MFAFTSMGEKIDKSVNQGRGPYCFKLGGQNYHCIERLLPDDGNSAKFSTTICSWHTNRAYKSKTCSKVNKFKIFLFNS